MPDWNKENGNGQTVENGEAVKNYVWQRQKTIPLKKIKREKKNFKLIFILSLIFKKSILQYQPLKTKDLDQWSGKIWEMIEKGARG